MEIFKNNYININESNKKIPNETVNSTPFNKSNKKYILIGIKYYIDNLDTLIKNHNIEEGN